MSEDEKLDLILNRLSSMSEDVATLKQDAAELKEDVAVLKKDVSLTRMQMENDILYHIRIVAENHLDLSRHLKEVLDQQQIIEDLSVKTGSLNLRVSNLEKICMA